jgi:hypothetical protein
MSVKTERIKTIESGSPLAKHSLNQTRIYNGIRMEKKAFGPDKKKEKSIRRRQKNEAKVNENLADAEIGAISIVDFTRQNKL